MADTQARATQTRALTPQRLGRLRSRLLDWYAEHGEDFPWRDAGDPYAALVAGVCSQQTQMSRVLPLWKRWMAEFPTLPSAAEASRAAVLRTWGDAGYPRRAAHLHETARRCVAEHGGALPREEAALLALPGVGPFTVAIVRCFGFGEEAVAIDTNVVRVIGRVVHGDLQPATETPPRALRASAERLLRAGTAALWNPALMDFGARVCLPWPRCESCVVASLCEARPRFASGECATPVRAQPGFEGSDRQWRGRILRELRGGAAASMSTSGLVARLSKTADDRANIRRLIADLARDGLVWQERGSTGLGDGPH